MNELTPAAIKQIEAGFALRREACELIQMIAAEFNSYPMSVQCFDLRIVNRVQRVAAKLGDLERKGVDF